MEVIGNIEGDFSRYLDLIRDKETTVQLGNFGMKRTHDAYFDFPVDVDRHHILFGSDDFYPYLHYPHSLGDFGYLELPEGYTAAYVRGGRSPLSRTHAHAYRGSEWTNYRDRMYWEDLPSLQFVEQELDADSFYLARRSLHYRRPEIILTHEWPQRVYTQITGNLDVNHTRLALDQMFSEYRPQLWVCGHHGVGTKKIFGRTTFICLSSFQTVNLLHHLT